MDAKVTLQAAFSEEIYFQKMIDRSSSRLMRDLMKLDEDKSAEIWQHWFHDFGFLEYLGCRIRNPKCCGFQTSGTNQRSCVPSRSCIGDMSDAEIQKKTGFQFSRRIKTILLTRKHEIKEAVDDQPAIPSIDLAGLGVPCASCHIELTQYNPEILPSEQHITTFQIVWDIADACHTFFNAKELVCRACHHIWNLSNCNWDRFIGIRNHLFRVHYDQATLDDKIRLYHASRIDVHKRIAVANKSVYGTLDTYRDTWASQFGLACYPLSSNNHEACGKHWKKIKSIVGGLTSEGIANSALGWLDDIDHIIPLTKGQVIQTTTTKKPTQLTQEGKKKRKLEEKHQESAIQHKQLLTEQLECHTWRLQLWIPIDPQSSSHSFWGKSVTPRDRNRPVAPDNYFLTTELLGHLEKVFDYSQFLQWLMCVCYWNLGKSVDLDPAFYTSFRPSRFKPLNGDVDYAADKRWVMNHPIWAKDKMQLQPFLQNSHDDPKKIKIPLIRYDVYDRDMDSFNKYMSHEIVKLFKPADEKEGDVYLVAAKRILHYLQLKEQELRLHQQQVEFYNEHLYPVQSQLQEIKERQQQIDLHVQPVMARLQQHHLDTAILEAVGLSIDQSVKEKGVTKFNQLLHSEQADLIHAVLSQGLNWTEEQMKQFLDDVHNRTVIQDVLDLGKVHVQKIAIAHPRFKQEKAKGPKRLTLSKKAANVKMLENKEKAEKIADQDASWMNVILDEAQ